MSNEILFPCCNFDRGRSAAIKLVVVHATRGGPDSTNDWTATVNWFNNPAAQVSSHILIGKNGQVGRFVTDTDTAWHATYLNPRSLGVEQEQRTDNEFYPDAQLISTAEVTKLWCEKYGIPKVRIFDESKSGIIGHEDSAQGRSFGKTDPGYMFPWDRFMELIQMSDQELAILKMQMALIKAIVEGRYQDAFNILRYVGCK